MFFTTTNLGAQSTGVVADQMAAPFLVGENWKNMSKGGLSDVPFESMNYEREESHKGNS